MISSLYPTCKQSAGSWGTEGGRPDKQQQEEEQTVKALGTDWESCVAVQWLWFYDSEVSLTIFLSFLPQTCSLRPCFMEPHTIVTST